MSLGGEQDLLPHHHPVLVTRGGDTAEFAESELV